MNKKQRKKIAQETLEIIESGKYETDGYCALVDLPIDIAASVMGTKYYGRGPLAQKTRIEVTDQSTLQAAHELCRETVGTVGVLNFASAKNPGGGFLRGTQAQEETLARSSTLYASLNSETAKPFYEAHREESSAYYSDRMIYSPQVTVFRDDHGSILDTPYTVDVVTAAAPNVTALQEQNRLDETVIHEKIFPNRVRKMLHIFHENRVPNLILGAWGCGVFGNSPVSVAEAFALAFQPQEEHEPAGEFNGKFSRVRFAIPNKNSENHQAFLRWFDLHDKEYVVW